MIMFFDEIDQFYKYYFYYWGKLPTMHGWRKIVFMKPHLYFFSSKQFVLFLFIENYY